MMMDDEQGYPICGTITVAVGPMLDGGHRLSGCDGLQLQLLSPIHEILKNMKHEPNHFDLSKRPGIKINSFRFPIPTSSWVSLCSAQFGWRFDVKSGQRCQHVCVPETSDTKWTTTGTTIKMYCSWLFLNSQMPLSETKRYRPCFWVASIQNNPMWNKWINENKSSNWNTTPMIIPVTSA